MGIFGKSLLAGLGAGIAYFGLIFSFESNFNNTGTIVLGAFGAILFLTMLFWSGKGEENKGGKDNE